MGAVTAYKMTASSTVDDSLGPPTVLTGKERHSRFGTSLLALGRLDDDKFEDFAVGAPGEDDGRGAIYIYYGDANLALSKYEQRPLGHQMTHTQQNVSFSLEKKVTSRRSNQKNSGLMKMSKCRRL